MPTFEITATPYGPEDSDATPADYLIRCGEALLGAYGYEYTVLGAAAVRQLQVNIPDDGVPGGRRAVLITAPDVVMDVHGDVMTSEALAAKYGQS